MQPRAPLLLLLLSSTQFQAVGGQQPVPCTLNICASRLANGVTQADIEDDNLVCVFNTAGLSAECVTQCGTDGTTDALCRGAVDVDDVGGDVYCGEYRASTTSDVVDASTCDCCTSKYGTNLVRGDNYENVLLGLNQDDPFEEAGVTAEMVGCNDVEAACIAQGTNAQELKQVCTVERYINPFNPNANTQSNLPGCRPGDYQCYTATCRNCLPSSEAFCNGGKTCVDPLRNFAAYCSSCFSSVAKEDVTSSMLGYAEGADYTPTTDGVIDPVYVFMNANGQCELCPQDGEWQYYLFAILFLLLCIKIWAIYDSPKRPAPRSLVKRKVTLSVPNWQTPNSVKLTWMAPRKGGKPEERFMYLWIDDSQIKWESGEHAGKTASSRQSISDMASGLSNAVQKSTSESDSPKGEAMGVESVELQDMEGGSQLVKAKHTGFLYQGSTIKGRVHGCIFKAAYPRDAGEEVVVMYIPGMGKSETEELPVPKYIDQASDPKMLLTKDVSAKAEKAGVTEEKQTREEEAEEAIMGEKEEPKEGEEKEEEKGVSEEELKDLGSVISGQINAAFSGDTSMFLIIFGGLQLNISMLSINANWPKWYVNLFAGLNIVVNFNPMAATPPECSGANIIPEPAFQSVVLKAFIPLLFFGILYGLKGCGFMLKFCQQKCNCLSTPTNRYIANELEGRTIAIMVFMMMMLYNTMVTNLMHFFSFIIIPDDPKCTVGGSDGPQELIPDTVGKRYSAAPNMCYPSPEADIGGMYFLICYVLFPFWWFSTTLAWANKKGWVQKNSVDELDMKQKSNRRAKLMKKLAKLKKATCCGTCLRGFGIYIKTCLMAGLGIVLFYGGLRNSNFLIISNGFCFGGLFLYTIHSVFWRTCGKCLPKIKSDEGEKKGNFQFAYKSLYKKYDAQFYWWELVVMAKKTAIVFGTNILSTPGYQVGWSFVSILVFFILHLRHMPYNRGNLDMYNTVKDFMDGEDDLAEEGDDEEEDAEDDEKEDKEDEDKKKDKDKKKKEEQAKKYVEWSTPWENFLEEFRNRPLPPERKGKPTLEDLKIFEPKLCGSSFLWWAKKYLSLTIPDIKEVCKNRNRWGKNNTVETVMFVQLLIMEIVAIAALDSPGEMLSSILVVVSWLYAIVTIVRTNINDAKEATKAIAEAVRSEVEATVADHLGGSGGGTAAASGPDAMVAAGAVAAQWMGISKVYVNDTGDIGLSANGPFLPIKRNKAGQQPSSEDTTNHLASKQYATAIPQGQYDVVEAMNADTIKIKIGDEELEFENPGKGSTDAMLANIANQVTEEILSKVTGGKLTDINPFKVIAQKLKEILMQVFGLFFGPLKLQLVFFRYYFCNMQLPLGVFFWSVCTFLPVGTPMIILVALTSGGSSSDDSSSDDSSSGYYGRF